MNMIPKFEAESTDLELHVDLCAQRYKELDSRLTKLDQKVDDLYIKVDAMGGDIRKTLITTAGTIICTIITGFFLIITKF